MSVMAGLWPTRSAGREAQTRRAARLSRRAAPVSGGGRHRSAAAGGAGQPRRAAPVSRGGRRRSAALGDLVLEPALFGGLGVTEVTLARALARPASAAPIPASAMDNWVTGFFFAAMIP
jgi:hypothetical protein